MPLTSWMQYSFGLTEPMEHKAQKIVVEQQLVEIIGVNRTSGAKARKILVEREQCIEHREPIKSSVRTPM